MDKDFFVNCVLIPRMYEMAETLFEGYGFKQSGDKKVAHLRHIDGASQAGTGKGCNVVIYQRTPHVVAEMGGHTWKGKSAPEVVEWYGGIFMNGASYGEALKVLAEKCGCVKQYREAYPDGKAEVDPIEMQRVTDLGVAQNHFIDTIHGEGHVGKSALAYMLERGWTMEEIDGACIGAFDKPMCGHIAGGLLKNWQNGIGSTYTIAIPLHTNGKLDCFQFRHTQKGGNLDKYMNETGHPKRLWGDIGAVNIIVEGALDYAHARVNGIRNVLCTGGKPSGAQMKYMAQVDRAEKVVLFFDADNAGRTFTRDFHHHMAQAGRGQNVFIISPQKGPDGRHCKDLDDYLTSATNAGWTNEQKQKGVADLVAQALPFDEWRPRAFECSMVESLLNEGVAKENQIKVGTVDGETLAKVWPRLLSMSDTQRRKFEGGVRKMFSSIAPSQVERAFETLKKWTDPKFCDISALKMEGVEMYHRDKENATTGKQGAENGVEVNIAPLTREYKNAVEGADEIYNSSIKGVPSPFAFVSEYDKRPIYISWMNGLSLLCANTGHGKTSILNAVALYDAKRNEALNNGKVTLYFSYEMAQGEILKDLFLLYNGDARLSTNSEATFDGFFENRLYTKNEAYQGQFFDKQTHFDPMQCVEVEGAQGPERVAQLSPEVAPKSSKENHFQHFKRSYDEFFGRMITTGGTLRVISENYTIEQLLAVVDAYVDRVRNHEQKEISTICIDYAQLLYSDTKSKAQRFDEIKWVMEQLNQHAKKKWHVPVIMPAQFNQTVNHPGKLAITAIGEAGAFSRFADTVIGFFNLKSLPKTPGAEEMKAIKAVLAGVGLNLQHTEKLPNLDGFMFARLLKKRKRTSEVDTLFRWTGELKKIWPNVNLFVSDPDFAKAMNLTWKTGGAMLYKTAENMQAIANQPAINAGVDTVENMQPTLRFVNIEKEDEKRAKEMKPMDAFGPDMEPPAGDTPDEDLPFEDTRGDEDLPF